MTTSDTLDDRRADNPATPYDAVAELTGATPRVVTVTAVVVTDGPSPYLSQTLAALGAQTTAPHEVVVVDVGTADSTGGYEDLSLAGTRFVAAPDARTFGEALHRGLVDGSPHGWLWALHDDAAPAPGALTRLLDAVEHSETVAIAGPKQVLWDDADPPALLEVGVRTSPLGRRMTDVQPGEIDQGQHDGRSDVLAVGLTGALIRRDVWAALGGTDPELGPFGDGLDLCRRARLAGHRVVVVPQAVVRHAQATLRDTRRLVTTGRHRRRDDDPSFRSRRRAELYLRLTWVRGIVVPLAAVAMVLWGPVAAMYRLAIKQPRRAGDEILAPLLAVASLPSSLRARRRRHVTSVLRRGALQPLEATWTDVVRTRRDARLAWAERRRVRRAPTEIERAELRQLAVHRRAALTLLTLALAGATAWVFGPVLGTLSAGGRLVGGTVLTASSDLGGLWRAATSGWVSTGLGSAGPADPFLLVLLPFAAVLGLQGAVNLLLVAALLLAGVGAWAASGAATRSVWLRALAVLVWTLSPPLLLGLSDGRLGAVIAHVMVPWIVLGVARTVGAAASDQVAAVAPDPADERRPATERPTGSIGAAAAAGLALAVAVAAEPVLLPVALVVLVVVAATARGGRRLLLLVPVPAVLVSLPLMAEVVQTWSDGGWRLLLASPGLPVAADAMQPWQIMLGVPGEMDPWFGVDDGPWVDALELAPYLLGALLVLGAVAALLRHGRRAGARVLWIVVVVGAVTALGAQLVTVAATTDGPVRGWPGVGTSIVVAGLLGATLLALRGRDDGEAPIRVVPVGRRRRRVRGAVSAVVGVLAVVVPVGGAWAWQDAVLDRSSGSVGALQARDDVVVPPVGRQMQDVPRQARVLTLQVDDDGAVTYALLRADGSQFVDSAATVYLRTVRDPLPDDGVADVVADLATAGSADVPAVLAGLGVGGVLVPAVEESTRARAEMIARIDTVAGLERVTEGRSSVLWRVAVPDASLPSQDVAGPAWARVEAPDGTVESYLAAEGSSVDAYVAPGAADRLVVIAEHADPGWRATLDGRPLPVADAGVQAFTMGSEGGVLEIGYVWPWRTPWLLATGLVLVVVGLLALPVARRRGVVR